MKEEDIFKKYGARLEKEAGSAMKTEEKDSNYSREYSKFKKEVGCENR